MPNSEIKKEALVSFLGKLQENFSQDPILKASNHVKSFLDQDLQNLEQDQLVGLLGYVKDKEPFLVKALGVPSVDIFVSKFFPSIEELKGNVDELKIRAVYLKAQESSELLVLGSQAVVEPTSGQQTTAAGLLASAKNTQAPTSTVNAFLNPTANAGTANTPQFGQAEFVQAIDTMGNQLMPGAWQFFGPMFKGLLSAGTSLAKGGASFIGNNAGEENFFGDAIKGGGIAAAMALIAGLFTGGNVGGLGSAIKWGLGIALLVGVVSAIFGGKEQSQAPSLDAPEGMRTASYSPATETAAVNKPNRQVLQEL